MANVKELMETRAEKEKKAVEYGWQAHPERYEITNSIEECRKLADGTKNVSIAGRVMAKRKMGKISFIDISDISGHIQLVMKRDDLKEDEYRKIHEILDIGDFIGIKGDVFTTQAGEKSVQVYEFQFLGKALRPLPEKFHGLVDTEIKYRQRYVDLITNEEARNVFLGRSKLYRFLHKYLGENGFLEVETPILQTAVSGASARPFFTHHNALDQDCNLRIAPEIYLKECIAGGFDRVYELAKCFRNEGMDPQHLQEFTQVEWYVAYWKYEDNIKFFTNFIQELLMELVGTQTIEYQGNTIDFSGEWKRIDYCKELESVLGFDALNIKEPDGLKKKIVESGLFSYGDLEEYKSISQIIDFVYKKKIRADIINPTIIFNYPASLKPLARRCDEDKNRVDVFQVVVCGMEICNAYSELVNPIEQRIAFEEQLIAKEQGDDETMDLDEPYLLAMEQGMPPISGLGFGIDRILTLIYNQESVRDVVLFPLMKPKDF